MVKKIINDKASQGQLILVENKEKHFAANEKYFAVRVQMPNDDLVLEGNTFTKHQEITLLLTEHQINEAYERALKNTEDCPKASLITDLFD